MRNIYVLELEKRQDFKRKSKPRHYINVKIKKPPFIILPGKYSYRVAFQLHDDYQHFFSHKHHKFETEQQV